MGLLLYNKKRNFKDTPEPAGKGAAKGGKLIFVIHRHKASHLHYDFRLEMEGVLKSWAVPKGPSMNPKDKRLAMMVEDHPYNYKDFEGIIPEGNYGAGIVEIWDKGYYTDLDGNDDAAAEKKLRAGLKAGSLKFTMHGKKLKGEFALVKLHGKQENAWLLIKHNDEHATEEEYNSEAETHAASPINKWLEAQNKPVAAKIVKKRPNKKLPGETRKLTDYITPMLAKETDQPFNDDDWIFEIKWDGYRAIAEVEDGKVRLYSRNGNTFNASYPPVVEALEQLGVNAVLDGEVVVTDAEGRPSFQLLQDYGNNEYNIQYYVFDVLSVNGIDTHRLPLLERKALLKKIIKKNDIVKYADHIVGKGKDFFKAIEKQDMEGIIAKKADSEYYPGKRTSEWLKIKHHKSQDVIIAGYTEPTGSRKYFGALVLGMKDGKKLKYVGHTGSGFTTQSLKEMYQLLQPLVQEKSPFSERVKTNMPVTWVKPELVCEIKFTEWTSDQKMRHPIFLHLRPDKKSKDVEIEAAKPVKSEKVRKKENEKEEQNENGKKENGQLAKKQPAKRGNVSSKESEKEDHKSNSKKSSARSTLPSVPVSNPDKIFFPEEKITKGDVVAYYQEMAPFILPYLVNRPESLKRNPNGIYDKGFFQKDAAGDAPDWVERVEVHSESADKEINYILCNNEATLTYLNNLGCIELNPWHSTVDDLDMPDYLIIDIDPSGKNTFEQVIEAANVIHEILERIGADSYCKTSGATGLHIYIPTAKQYTYDQVKDFALLVCTLAQEQLPEFTSLERNLKKRGNMIYLDYLQNRRGQTISSAYSLRPHPGATVSTPLLWKEVKSGLTPAAFTIHTIQKRLKKTGDLFAAVLGKGIDMEKCLKKLG